MDIDKIIQEEVQEVDLQNVELPSSMKNEENDGNDHTDNSSDEPASLPDIEKLSLEQLSGMIITGFNVVQNMIWNRYAPGFDANLTADECKVIDKPLRQVLKNYNITVTPPIALLIAVAGVEISKYMQLKMYLIDKVNKQNEEANQTAENTI